MTISISRNFFSADLGDWLYVLITRLLNKLGADLLGSIIQKVNKTLDVVRDSFTYAEQMGAIFKFLVDQTQTPNTKVSLFQRTSFCIFAAFSEEFTIIYFT